MIKRYDMYLEEDEFGEAYIEEYEDNHFGEWVKFDEVNEIINKLKDKIKKYETQRN